MKKKSFLICQWTGLREPCKSLSKPLLNTANTHGMNGSWPCRVYSSQFHEKYNKNPFLICLQTNLTGKCLLTRKGQVDFNFETGTFMNSKKETKRELKENGIEWYDTNLKEKYKWQCQEQSKNDLHFLSRDKTQYQLNSSPWHREILKQHWIRVHNVLRSGHCVGELNLCRLMVIA